MPLTSGEVEPYEEGEPAHVLVMAESVLRGGRVGFTVNEELWPEVTPEVSEINTLETWEIINETHMDHPFHLHGASFQVTSRGLINGALIAVEEREWKDTVNVSPLVLLFTGEVLMTHRPPQLYDPVEEEWRLAADFVQGDRMANGDHADHELVMLPDGRVVAVGFKSFVEGEAGRMLEIYSPGEDRWRLGAAVAPVRSRESILLLPDGRVLVMGGQKEDPSDPTPTNTWGQVALTDLYDPPTDTWRRLANLGVAREYHAMPILLPDGRVAIVGGEGAPGNEPSESVVEVFSPPYLFRGPRPRLEGLTQTSLQPGDTFRFRVTGTTRPTGVALLGAVATTHFMDSGPGRYLDLSFTVDGEEVTATLPSEPARAIPGLYLLFVLVDDIPSVGVLVRVAP